MKQTIPLTENQAAAFFCYILFASTSDFVTKKNAKSSFFSFQPRSIEQIKQEVANRRSPNDERVPQTENSSKVSSANNLDAAVFGVHAKSIAIRNYHIDS